MTRELRRRHLLIWLLLTPTLLALVIGAIVARRDAQVPLRAGSAMGFKGASPP